MFYPKMDSRSLRNFYMDKHIFVTGATGFIGKSVVEKILRSCPEVNTVYILIRQYQSDSVASGQSRYAQLLENPIFETLKNKNAECLKKIRPITGDIQCPLLGISESDRKELINNVSIVIHAAATVTFDQPLELYLQVNVNGLWKVMQLCKEMKQLKALVYVSTAYSNCDQTVVEEKVYPPPVGTEKVMNHLDDMGNFFCDLEAVAKSCRPNFYVYSKAIAEHLVALEAPNLPVCVVRPSVVTATLQETFAGWIDQCSGVTALFVGHGLGAIRVIKSDSEIKTNWVPVDVVANLIICAAWKTSCSPTQLKVYNCCTPKTNPLFVGEMVELMEGNVRKRAPFCKSLCYPSITMTKHDFIFNLRCFLFQFVPATIFDILLGNQTLSALRLHQKFQKVLQLLEHFTTNE